ncbi:MAG: oxidoreductase FAD-binding domain-containing [Trebouxia sp. A1-2]|nr:MAG: oxidoreductase FAD-binding domain-containing [Trebouxia sp. A1-2]
MELLQAGSNEYENARQKRILRNQQVLADLGLTSVELPTRHVEVPAVARKSKSEQVQLPPRRSKRQQGQPIEQQEEIDVASDMYPKVRSMSTFALAKRIGKIQNKAKMEASLDGVSQSGILDGCKGNAIAWVSDGVHLLNKCQSREGGVSIHHLVQDAAKTPNVRRPANLHGRSTSDVVGASQNGLWTHASNMQHLQCLSTQQESLDVMTFEFELPQLPANKSMFCHPGQFASFDFEDITPGKVLTRTWTISSPTEQIRQRKAFTISVKKDGLVSNWLWNNMRPGKTIGFKGVDGDFTLELIGSMAHSRTLLVAGGIGITPMRVMLAEQLARRQPTTLLYSVRTLSEAPFLNEFIEAAQSNRALLTLAVSVTRPTEQDSAQIRSIDSGSGVTWYQGRITADMIAQLNRGQKLLV